ncbi:hypothetical protein [Treponema sp.]|uniref:hypothetical protein n=1 Tax=Treponema sp. TaxID=166 RepID=UPI00298E5965|nr:hypothetical protein [Treponema sp.]MCR5612980.1 hypothetical protein [Treponema sp.]
MHRRKVLLFFLFAAFCALFFSCENSTPDIAKVEAKIVYDYENEKDLPSQRLSVFLQLNSDTRRADFFSIYNKESGMRWYINEPLISQKGSAYYAGYTSCSIPTQKSLAFPVGKYSIFYSDSEGNESYSEFALEYDSDDAVKKIDELKKKILKKESGNEEKIQMFIGVYSENCHLIYYGFLQPEWKIKNGFEISNSQVIFNKYKNSSFFRIFYEVGDSVYILPRVEKNADKQ